MKDFFISYTSADRSWAEWIAWELEATGYSTIIQAWDFRPGENFVLEMQAAASDADRTVLVLSEGYLQSSFTPSEWAAAFAQDPTGAQRRLVPVCIGKCEPKGVLRALIFIDLIGLDEATARAKLLEGIQDGRGKPAVAPAFPGAAPRPAFPGPAAGSGVLAPADAAAEPPLADPQKALARRRLLRGAIAYVAATGFVLLAAWVGLLSVIGADDWIERRYLSYMQRFLPVPVTKEVVLVRGTDGGPLGTPGPAWRRAHAEMVDALSLAGARVIVFDLYFEDTSTKDDLALAAAIQRAQARKTAVVLGARAFDTEDGRVRPRMSSVLAGLPVRWGTLGGDPSHRRLELAHRLDEGSAWRRIVADGVAVVPSLALQAVMQYEAGGQPVAAVLRPHGEAIEIRTGIPPSARRVVPVVGARLNLIVDVADDIRSLDYQTIHAERADPQALSELQGKVVVIGYEVEDEKWVAGGGRPRYKMEVQASAIAQILHDAFLYRPGPAAQYAVILAMGALAWFLRTGRRRWTAHAVPVRLATIDRRVDIPTAILAAVVVYGLTAFAVSKSLRVVPRFTYDLAALLLTYVAVGWALRGSSRPRFPRATAVPAVRDDLVA